MSGCERTGWRDELFSRWHRQIESGNTLKCVDGDWNEYCANCNETLAIFELCANLNRVNKTAIVTQKRAARLDVFACVLLYEAAMRPGSGSIDIRFRYRRLHPNPMPEGELLDAPAKAIAGLIWNIHRCCRFCGLEQPLPDGVKPLPRFAVARGDCIHDLDPTVCKVCNGTVKRTIKETEGKGV